MNTIKKLSNVKSLHDLYLKAEKDVRYQKICVCTLENLGCDHLATDKTWIGSYRGLLAYMDSLVGEYGESETQAECSMIAEINDIVQMRCMHECD